MIKKIFCFVLLVFLVVSACHKSSQLDDDKDTIESLLSKYGISDYTVNKNVYCQTIKEGTGKQYSSEDTVLVAIKYKVSLLSDTTVGIDSSLVKAITYTQSGLIVGVTYGLETMKVGGISVFYIPSSFAYGSNEIKGETNANLRFYCQLCEIKPVK